MKRLVILAVLLTCQQAQADTYILVFDSYPSKEAKQVKALLLRRVKPPIHCHHVPHGRATKAAFTHNLFWLKTRAKKGDTVIIYVSSHGRPGDGNLLISATHGPDVPSSLIRKTTEALPCPCLVLIDACFAGSALHEPWRKTTVVCAANDHEVSWTGGMSKAVCQELRQPRQWTMSQLAVDLMWRIPACSRSQHPMACIGESNALLTQ